MKTLIDKALKVCGSTKELARQLDVAPSVISMMKRHRTISPDTAAILAAVAGEDAREAAIQAMIENAVGTRREGVLREILGKGLALGVAGLLLFSYNGEAISKQIKEVSRDKPLTIYTSWNISKLILKSLALVFLSLLFPAGGAPFRDKNPALIG